MVKISQNKLQNLFHTLLNNPINKKGPQKKSKAVKDRGVGVGLTAVKDSLGFFRLPLVSWKTIIKKTQKSKKEIKKGPKIQKTPKPQKKNNNKKLKIQIIKKNKNPKKISK